jgi:hypothetical protein
MAWWGALSTYRMSLSGELERAGYAIDWIENFRVAAVPRGIERPF